MEALISALSGAEAIRQVALFTFGIMMTIMGLVLPAILNDTLLGGHRNKLGEIMRMKTLRTGAETPLLLHGGHTPFELWIATPRPSS